MKKPLITLCLSSSNNESWDHYNNWVDSFFSSVIPQAGSIIKTKKGWFKVKETPFIFNYSQVQEDNEKHNGSELIFIHVSRYV